MIQHKSIRMRNITNLTFIYNTVSHWQPIFMQLSVPRVVPCVFWHTGWQILFYNIISFHFINKTDCISICQNKIKQTIKHNQSLCCSFSLKSSPNFSKKLENDTLVFFASSHLVPELLTFVRQRHIHHTEEFFSRHLARQGLKGSGQTASSVGVTKRCRLPWLTNSALVYASPNTRGWGVAGSQPMSNAVYITWHGAQINFGDLTP